ncbi:MULTISPECIES: PLP-dependent aminotransferase family protein [Nocardia]|uniref:MocR-like pyridoxine biosynthesis transcription factor PdxR n=1 Tax=Nocardia TaxID=1817 RepID=UPI0009EE3F1B|nr:MULTISPECIES: PLP-dependent aminotransferase family protein [Nocardia]MBF6274374.1 PLP-dependent aminotransferase family protein [Nocardia nova]
MDVHVTLAGRGDLGGQIYRQIKAAVLDGRLIPGRRLPPSRELARRLAVSRNTVTGAYDRLVAEGLAESRVGAGIFVRATVARQRHHPADATSAAVVHPQPLWADIRVPAPGFFTDTPPYDLRPGIPDVRLFPYEAWRRLTSQAFRRSSIGTGMPIDPAGLPALRAAIARHIGVSRAVQVTADEIIITQGIQQALDLVGRVLLRPGDRVVIENPCYPLVRELFRSLGADVVGVDVDSEGLRVDLLPDRTRIVCVTPSHQFPLGVPMSSRRRRALLDWASSRDVVVIEDDYDTEFRYGGRPLETLHSIDTAGRVIYVGTFSKVMLPVLRIGFVAAPAPLFAALRAAKYVTDWHSPQPAQVALLGFIEEGMLAKHIRRMRREYQARHERIVELLSTRFADLLTVIPSAVGLHVSAWTQPGVDAAAVAARARTDGVGIFPISRYRMSDGPDGLIVGYGAIATTDVDHALDLLRTALERNRQPRSETGTATCSGDFTVGCGRAGN